MWTAVNPGRSISPPERYCESLVKMTSRFYKAQKDEEVAQLLKVINLLKDKLHAIKLKFFC